MEEKNEWQEFFDVLGKALNNGGFMISEFILGKAIDKNIQVISFNSDGKRVFPVYNIPKELSAIQERNIHSHIWKSQYMLDGSRKLFYTGNLVCDCGEICWRDEVVDVIQSASKTSLYALRGNSPSVKSAQQGVQLTSFGVGGRVRLGNYLIRLGFRLAKFGGN